MQSRQAARYRALRDFSEWLGAVMLARRLTQRDVAELSGVDHGTVSRLLHERRAPLLKTAVKIVEALT